MSATTRLSFRRAGTQDWVEIDPTTPGGQRLLASFHITIPMEEEMTATSAAAAAAGYGGGSPRLHVVPGDNIENMGALLRMRRAASRLTDRLRSTARGAWGWVVRTFHLDSVVAYVKGAGSWVWNKIAAAGRFLGTGGLTGAGLLAVSTSAGRSLLGLAFKPIGWVLGLIGRAWVTVENALYSDAREGGIRNGLSARMADVRTFLFGDGTTSGKAGIIPTAVVWTLGKVGRFLMLDSLTMRATRTAGIALVAPRILSVVDALPLGMLRLPVRLLVMAFLAWSAYEPFADDVSRVARNLRNELSGDIKKADREIAKTEHVVSREVTEAAKATTAPSRPVNRAEKRAAARTSR